jgi:hypothetical protein
MIVPAPAVGFVFSGALIMHNVQSQSLESVAFSFSALASGGAQLLGRCAMVSF